MTLFALRELACQLRYVLLVGCWMGLMGGTAARADWALSDWGRLGLEPAWHFQIDSGRSQSRPPHFGFHVSRTETTKAFEVVYSSGSRLFAPRHLDAFGHAIGEAEAARLADVEVRVLATRGIKAEVKVRETPLVTIYVQTAIGELLALNGETGELRWRFPTGRPDLPSLSPAANDEFAAVVNGSTLYVVRLADGKLVFERRLAGAAGAGPAITNDFVFVPQLNGTVQVFRLAEDMRSRPPIDLASFGGTHIQPTVSPKSVSWPTDRGLLYVVDAETAKTRFRLEARDSIVSHAAFLAPNRLLVASIDGYMFCVDEDTGRMLWQFSSGESLATAPVAVDNQAFVVSERGVVFAVDAERGLETWKAGGVSQVVSASASRIYCAGSGGEMVVLDRESGARLQELPLSIRGQFITNDVSDRIYLSTDSGRLLCLHERAARWPTIHAYLPTETTDEPTKPSSSEQPAADASSKPTEEDDIFGTSETDEPEEDMLPAEDDAFNEDDLFGDGGGDDDLFGGDELF